MIAFISSPAFVEHATGPYHPERPDRIRAIHRAVREAGLVRSADPFPELEIDLGPLPRSGVQAVEIAPRPASVEELVLVHPREHVDRVRHVCEIGGGVLDQGDTPVCAESYELARLSAGGVLVACDFVMTGAIPGAGNSVTEVTKPHEVRRAFSAGRPPGHHAEVDRAMGFCLFANVAIGARYLQQKYGVKKVAIVDFDVHHGNGTQAAFEADPSVYFVSMHEHPRTCYPGSGYEWEVGVGAGRGFTMNVPFQPGAGDDEYLAALTSKVIPALEEYGPEVLMISAGFDGHADDPLAHVELSEDGFGRMTRELVQFADRRCGGRVISALEGGYNLRALGRCVVRHMAELGAP
ncbi:MAG TPA: histone deacetylase [Tepidisphaeraceae bacterium]|nr:histone deacetylase [Tepidisphaeraceae bacterium]